MKNFTHLLVAGLFGLSLTNASCQKDDAPSEAPAEETRVVELTSQKAVTDALYDDVSMEVIRTSADNGLTQPITVQQACATVSIVPQDPTVWPKTITVDFGNAGCNGLNGYLRKGKIIYTLDRRLLNDGAVLNVNFDNYSVNGYKLEGTYTITNNGSTRGLNITIVLSNGRVTYPDGTVYSKSSNTTWVQSAGQTTFNILDDEYSVTGNGAISDASGNRLTATTRGALLRRVNCTNTVSGQADLTYNNIAGVLDFGSGACDRNAMITVGGKNYEVLLP
jgi:hypothetical protein